MAKEKTDRDKARIITPEFRVSYPHLIKPQAPKDGKPKFSVTMLYPKDLKMEGFAPDGKTPRTILRAIKNAKIAEFGPNKEDWPDLESPIQDGDDARFADKPGYPGHWIIKAMSSEDQRPSIVDRDMTPITEASQLYPGCYARAYIMAYVWFYPNREKPMKKGVGFILDHVQKLRDGKPFGGKKPVEQVFAPLEDLDDDSDAEDDSDE